MTAKTTMPDKAPHEYMLAHVRLGSGGAWFWPILGSIFYFSWFDVVTAAKIYWVWRIHASDRYRYR